MHRLHLLIATTITLAACGAEIGSGDARTESRDISGAIEVENALFVDTNITVDPDADGEVLELTCDDNLLARIITEVEGDRLLIRTQPGVSLVPRAACTADIVLPRLDAVQGSGSGPTRVLTDADTLSNIGSSGSGSVAVEGVAGALTQVRSSGSGGLDVAVAIAPSECALDLVHTGSGSVDVGSLEACSLTVDTSGSGRTRLAGQVSNAEIRVSGSGGVHDAALRTQRARIDSSGSGRIELTVTESVEVRASGSGGVIVHGRPEERDVSETGSGRVRFE